MLGFASTHGPIDGIGTGPRRSADEAAIGPCITSVIDMRNAVDVEEGLVIEEGSLPGALAPFLAIPLGRRRCDHSTIEGGIVELAQRKWSELQGLVGAAGKGHWPTRRRSW